MLEEREGKREGGKKRKRGKKREYMVAQSNTNTNRRRRLAGHLG